MRIEDWRTAVIENRVDMPLDLIDVTILIVGLAISARLLGFYKRPNK